jgi:hypothetical protein
MPDVKEALANGWGTKILSTALGILLAGAIASNVGMYTKINVVLAMLEGLEGRVERLENRVDRVEYSREGTTNEP